MEERMNRLTELYKEISTELEAWMKEDMERDARPAAYSVDQAAMFARTSYMWTNDAAAQVLHFEKNVAPKLTVD